MFRVDVCEVSQSFGFDVPMTPPHFVPRDAARISHVGTNVCNVGQSFGLVRANKRLACQEYFRIYARILSCTFLTFGSTCDMHVGH